MTREACFSVLTANVGNISPGARRYRFKLIRKDVEAVLARRIGDLSPDVVALQEVLAPWQTQAARDPGRAELEACTVDVPQARRLLGPDYSIACDIRNQFECIAVRKDFGQIDGCLLGDFAANARTGASIPGCNADFTVSAVTVRAHSGLVFDVVNLHPQSLGASCRARAISQVFEPGGQGLIREEKALLMGDSNLDPWRDIDDESVLAWKSAMESGWAGRAFKYHNGLVAADPPKATVGHWFWSRTVDLVVSNFASGPCHVLGRSPGTQRLDGGSGTDHRAIFGTLRAEVHSNAADKEAATQGRQGGGR